MPLRTDKDLGSNVDNSLNSDYCRFCYQLGKFTDEGISLAQKIDKLVAIAKDMHIPEDKARLMAEMNLPKLKRWKS